MILKLKSSRLSNSRYKSKFNLKVIFFCFQNRFPIYTFVISCEVVPLNGHYFYLFIFFADHRAIVFLLLNTFRIVAHAMLHRLKGLFCRQSAFRKPDILFLNCFFLIFYFNCATFQNISFQYCWNQNYLLKVKLWNLKRRNILHSGQEINRLDIRKWFS
jgi:hypothetical protein